MQMLHGYEGNVSCEQDYKHHEVSFIYYFDNEYI